MMADEKKAGFRQRLTNTLIAQIEENDGMPWQKGWDNLSIRPFNPKSKHKYRGGNVVGLMLAQIERNSNDPRWMTLKQANDSGLSIRKGAKAMTVEYWKEEEVSDRRKPTASEHGVDSKDDGTDNDGEVRKKWKVFYSTVFNGEDIVGLPEYVTRKISFEPNELAERWIKSTGAVIEHRNISRSGMAIAENQAYYSHKTDKVVVPPRESFKSEADYYATVLHELGHWTGHHSRLNRRAPDESRPFGSPEYAKEELRAELASFFMASMLGIDGQVQNHASYTASWLTVLKDDRNEIFRAAADAERIVSYMLKFDPELAILLDAEAGNNLLPDEPIKKKPNLMAGLGELPKFGKPVETSDDWRVYEATVRSACATRGVEGSVVDKALDAAKKLFPEISKAVAGIDGGIEKTALEFAIALKEQMAFVHERSQRWEQFVDLVRTKGAGVANVDMIDMALDRLGERFKQVLDDSVAKGVFKQDEVDALIGSLIYGDDGRRPIDASFVQQLLSRDDLGIAPLDEEGDFLVPIGDGFADEFGVMDDAEIQCGM